jgi:hypothetical protein
VIASGSGTMAVADVRALADLMQHRADLAR